MGEEKAFKIAVAAIIALILCGAGILCQEIDLFSKLSHPLVEKYPNISKRFGTVFIRFSLIWFVLIVFIILSN